MERKNAVKEPENRLKMRSRKVAIYSRSGLRFDLVRPHRFSVGPCRFNRADLAKILLKLGKKPHGRSIAIHESYDAMFRINIKEENAKLFRSKFMKIHRKAGGRKSRLSSTIPGKLPGGIFPGGILHTRCFPSEKPR